jgi:hypothetical protein
MGHKTSEKATGKAIGTAGKADRKHDADAAPGLQSAGKGGGKAGKADKPANKAASSALQADERNVGNLGTRNLDTTVRRHKANNKRGALFTIIILLHPPLFSRCVYIPLSSASVYRRLSF